MEKMEGSLSRKASGHGWVNSLINLPQRVLNFVLGNKIFSGILVLGAYLRLYKISDYMTFLGDEGRDVLVVKGILEGDLTLLGPRASAADFFTGPIYYYLMAPFLWLFNYDPVGPAVMIALLGIASIFLIYYIGRKVFGINAALIAAFLYSISPVVIAYSRSSWNPNPMPFFSLILIALIYKTLKKKFLAYFLAIGFLLGIMLQLHYIELFFGGIVFLIVVLNNFLSHRSKMLILSIKELLFIFVGFLVGFSPFLAFEFRHGFPNLRTISGFVFSQESYGDTVSNPFWVTIYDVFFRLFGRLITRFPPPEQVNAAEHSDLFIWYWATIALGIASIYMITKIKDPLWRLIFAVWLGAGVLLFGFYQKAIYDYYFEFLFPLPFFLAGYLLHRTKRSVILIALIWYISAVITLFHLGLYENYWLLVVIFSIPVIIVLVLNLDRLSDKRNFALTFSSSLVFLLIVMVNSYGYPFRHEPNRQKDQVRSIVEFVIEKAEGKPFNFALLTPGNSDHGYRYFFEYYGKTPVTLENDALDPERRSVTDQLLIICEDPNCQPLGHSLWEVAGFGRAEIENSWDVSVVKVFKLRHYKN